MTATPIHSVVMLFEKIPLGKLVAVQLAALLEQDICVTCLTRTAPGAGVGDQDPAFSVRKIFYKCRGSGQSACPAPSFLRCGVVPTE